MIVYFSTKSEMTKRFVDRFNLTNIRIPFNEKLEISDNFILITPTYGGGHLKGAVPPQVVKFLNDENNRKFIKGVISCGDTNYSPYFATAGDIISKKCNIPLIKKVELSGGMENIEYLENLIKDILK